MRGKRYETEKKIWGGTGRNQFNKEQSAPEAQSANDVDTRGMLASEYGLNRSTVGRDYQFARAVDILPAATKEKIISGDLCAKADLFIKIARLNNRIHKKSILFCRQSKEGLKKKS
ncbi:MAG: hypothetical protein AB2L20_30120 [Mangrovibacterium sp.]